MNPIIKSYLNHTYQYRFTGWPDSVHTQKQALEEGLNCITLTHLLLFQLFGTKLPENLRSIELFQDNIYFHNVDNIKQLKMGDVLFFGRKEECNELKNLFPQYDTLGNLLNISELPLIHLGIFSGDFTEEDEPLIIHANGVDKKVSLWPLNKFNEHKKYSGIQAIKRLKIMKEIM